MALQCVCGVMCDFVPNDFVECINDRPLHRQSTTMPELGRFYTVESVRRVSGGWSVRLQQLVPDCFKGGPCTCGNCGWDSNRFRRIYRPSDDKLADLSALLDEPLEIGDDIPNEWVAALRSAAKAQR